jgi:Arc/MetJ family transcription regulator
MGGTAINLDVIQEQQWFYELCLGSLGLGKAEVGMIEDVNRANGEIEADRVYKRVGQAFGKQFERAFLHIARQFDAFTELGEPFTPTLAHSDPRAEAAKQERLREEYEAGKLTLRQYVRRAGDDDVADDPDQFTAEINGTTIDYGAHPKWVARRLMSAAGATDPDVGGAGGGSDDIDSEAGDA